MAFPTVSGLAAMYFANAENQEFSRRLLRIGNDLQFESGVASVAGNRVPADWYLHV
jgi:hypothetical protein